ncbi:hypothetical protein HGRIS_001341 [Hohenbuehelia grisea]|uniref:Uncharacterized protein n=1 Tax=Hohenbuehelia grisea TaxID=104357 RepID=A0ABR3JP09_9AGAR
MPDLTIDWSRVAQKALEAFTASDFEGVDPKVFHETKVQEFWSCNQNVPQYAGANKARIRRAAHTGGSDPNAPDHITVSLRDKNKELATVHVNTGR